MMLVGEILIEIVMIAAVMLAVSILAWVIQAGVREQVYLRRQRRDRDAVMSVLITSPRPERRGPQTARVAREKMGALREKHV